MSEQQKRQSGQSSRGKPVIMHSMQKKPGESVEVWAKRMVKELKISLARQAGLIGDEPGGDDEQETGDKGAGT